EWDKALQFFNRSLQIRERIGDTAGLATTWGNLGYLYEAQGDYGQALEYASKALAVFEQLGAYEAAQVKELVQRLREKMEEAK
ncbi:MAG: tetratricopeptide repeat protein, partial [Anaerolineae bacterium]